MTRTKAKIDNVSIESEISVEQSKWEYVRDNNVWTLIGTALKNFVYSLLSREKISMAIGILMLLTVRFGSTAFLDFLKETKTAVWWIVGGILFISAGLGDKFLDKIISVIRAIFGKNGNGRK